MCGGGSADAAVVSEERGNIDAGVDVSRSEYDMNERRLLAGVGEGGCESGRPDVVEEGDMATDAAGRAWIGCSRVVVVGDDSTDEDVEKYADVGVTIDGGVYAPGTCGPVLAEFEDTFVCIVGRADAERGETCEMGLAPLCALCG